MTPEDQAAEAKKADPDCEIEVRDNTNSVLTEKSDLKNILGDDYDVDNLIPQANNCDGGQTEVKYIDKKTGKVVLDGNIDADGKVKLTDTSNGTSFEYENNNETGQPKSDTVTKTNPDGSKNTYPTDASNTSIPPTYTPPPSANNPNPTPQPSAPGCS
jgi:hypothetical protein